MSSVLSQQEIDALLNDTFPEGEQPQERDSSVNKYLSPVEADALGEIANIAMGTSATTLSSLLGKKVEITTPQIESTTIKELRERYPKPYVIVDVDYNEGLEGSNVLIIHTYDAGVIVDLMMGGDGNNPPLELNDLHLSAIAEAMNQMMGSACTSLSQMLEKRIDITPPSLDLLQLDEREILVEEEDAVIKIAFRMVIQGLVDSEMMQLLPVDFAKALIKEVLRKNELEASNSEEAHVSQQAQATAQPVAATHTQSVVQEQVQPMRESFQPQVPVAQANFPEFSPTPTPVNSPPNLNIILDVGLQLSVELGRTNKKVKDILELNTGSIVELDKLSGEPVDVLVNGKPLAKGEVVIIDENFGVRITEILSPTDRVKNLK